MSARPGPRRGSRAITIPTPISLSHVSCARPFNYNQAAVTNRGESMTNLDNVLQELRQEHKQAQIQVEKLKEAISVIEGLGTSSSRTSVNGSRPKRIISAASRRRMAQAQRARWAKYGKKPQPALKTIVTVPK